MLAEKIWVIVINDITALNRRDEHAKLIVPALSYSKKEASISGADSGDIVGISATCALFLITHA